MTETEKLMNTAYNLHKEFNTMPNALVISQEDFKRNQAIDVSAYVKQLQGNDYIPWGVAISLMREFRPTLAVGFENDVKTGHPFIDAGESGVYLCAYIYDKLTLERTPAIFFPVRNNKRQAAVSPGLDTIGNQQQRAIAKVIAQETGIGWTLYSRMDESMMELEATDRSKPSPGKIAPTAAPTNKRTDSLDLDF